MAAAMHIDPQRALTYLQALTVECPCKQGPLVCQSCHGLPSIGNPAYELGHSENCEECHGTVPKYPSLHQYWNGFHPPYRGRRIEEVDLNTFMMEADQYFDKVAFESGWLCAVGNNGKMIAFVPEADTLLNAALVALGKAEGMKGEPG